MIPLWGRGGAGAGTTDPQFANVSLLAHFNGANGGTVFTDSSLSANAATRVGLAVTDTGTFKYGTASLALVAASSCGVNYPNGANLTGIFGDAAVHTRYSTLECWFKTTSATVNQTILSSENGAFSTGAWSILMSNSSSGTVEFWQREYNNAVPMLKTTVGGYNDGNWHFLAVTKDVTTGFSLWIDGALQQTVNLLGAINSPPGVFAIGYDQTIPGRYFDGWIDDVRVTTSTTDSAACRYTSAFTPPTAQFPDS